MNLLKYLMIYKWKIIIKKILSALSSVESVGSSVTYSVNSRTPPHLHYARPPTNLTTTSNATLAPVPNGTTVSGPYAQQNVAPAYKDAWSYVETKSTVQSFRTTMKTKVTMHLQSIVSILCPQDQLRQCLVREYPVANGPQETGRSVTCKHVN